MALATTLINEDDSNPELENVTKYTETQLLKLRDKLLALEKSINDIKIKKHLYGDPYPGNFLLELLKKVGINSENRSQIKDMCMDLGKFLIMSNSQKIKNKQGTKLKKISYMLHIVFSNENDEEDNSCYKVSLNFLRNKSNSTLFEISFSNSVFCTFGLQ